MTLTIGSCIIGALTGGENFYASKRPYKDGNVRRAVLRDGLYLVSVAVHARLCDGVDVRAEFIGLSFAAETNVHGNFDLHFARSSRLAGICGRRGLEQIARSGGRILFRVDFCLCAVKFGKRRNSKLQTICSGEYFNCSADNLRGRNNFDDVGFGRKFMGGVDDGGLSVYSRRPHESNGGGISRREIEKNFGRAVALKATEHRTRLLLESNQTADAPDVEKIFAWSPRSEVKKILVE